MTILTETLVPSYVHLTARDRADLDERSARICAAMENDPAFHHRVRVAVRDSQVVAAASLHAWLPDLWQAVITADPAHADVLHDLLQEWVASAATVATGRLSTRLDVPNAISDALADGGWQHCGYRREFRTPVGQLPPDLRTSSIEWRDVTEVGLTQSAAVFGEAGQGPDWDDDDDPHALIVAYLDDRELTTSIEIGFVEGEPAAFLCAQAADDGWCTLTFLGITPAHRSRGLGTAVHRRGFELMRRLGGTTYHGGTSARNAAMLHLFDKHGCVPYRHLETWELDIPHP